MQVGVELSGLYETAAASVLFVLLPAGGRTAALFAAPGEELHNSNLRKSLVMRLERASDALEGVSNTVDSISKKLSELCAPDMEAVVCPGSFQNLFRVRFASLLLGAGVPGNHPCIGGLDGTFTPGRTD